MAEQAALKMGENAFERTVGILDMIYKFPDQMSDEEVDGVTAYINPDIRNTVLGLLEIEAARSVEISMIRKVIDIFREAQRAKEEGKKIVFIPFTFPPELIFCFENLFPVCTEIVGGLAVNVLAGQGERYWDFAMGMGLPDSLCSANTITAGSLCMGPTLSPDAIVSNSVGSCDPNAKIHAFIADYMCIPQFILEKPVDESARGWDMYHQYMKNLVRDLEEFAGEEVSEERMREVLQRVYEAADLYYEFWELKKARPCPVPNIFNLNIPVLRGHMWGREEAVEIMQGMVDVSKERLRKGEYTAPEEVARVYMSYLYFLFDFSGFFNWMEKKGITILGGLLGVHFFPPADMSSKEGMLKGFTEIAWNMPMTRQMGAPSMSVRWLEDTDYAIADLGADCCVYCGHAACKHAEGTLSFIRRETMKRHKIPTLILKGDAFDKRNLPINMVQEEIERFVEKVVSKKRKAPRKKRKAVNP